MFNRLRLEQVEQIKNQIKFRLIYTNGIVLLVAGFGSYFLARKTLEPIEDAMESQNRFTADASHELRTPLTALKAEIEVALRDKNMPHNEAIEVLKSNLQEVEKLHILIDQLLSLSRVGGLSLNLEAVTLQSIVSDAIKSVEGLAKEKHIIIKTDVSDQSIRVDKSNMVRVLVILLDNAIKYSDSQAKVDVRVFVRNEGVLSAFIEVLLKTNTPRRSKANNVYVTTLNPFLRRNRFLRTSTWSNF